MQTSLPITTSGLADWSATVTFDLADGSTEQGTASGTAAVLSYDNSVYGAGWNLAGMPQLAPVTGGVLWLDGQGDVSFFANAGSGVFSTRHTPPVGS